MNTQPHNAENGEALEQAARQYGLNNCNGWTMYIDMLSQAFKCGSRYQARQERTFTESETLKMLEALRQRCAEEAKMYEDKSQHWMCPRYNIDREALRKIDLTQFLPTLNK